MSITWDDINKANEILMKQKIRKPTLIFSPDQIDLLYEKNRIRKDKNGKMWIQNWYPGMNEIEIFTSNYLPSDKMLYIKNKDEL